MDYFVTGATGFIGRHLLERLLAREGDDPRARPRRARARARGADRRLGRRGPRDHAVRRRPRRSRCSASTRRRASALRGTVDHFFHLAAIYDMTADEERNALLNVGGTQQRRRRSPTTSRRASSTTPPRSRWPASYQGHFTEDMFDEGQPLPSPYHRTKFESEKLVRTRVPGAWRVYRPAIVVGDSRTGEMDKIDGPYYFFKAIQKVAPRAAGVVPARSALEVGWTNIVPVDWVAAAMDHIAHEPGLDGQAFHLVNPRPQRAGDVLNTFARAAPRAADGRCGSTSG